MRRAICAAIGLAAIITSAYAAERRPSASSNSGASGQVLFSQDDWIAPAKGKLPNGVTLAGGHAHVATVNGRRFLQVTDSASIDIALKGDLPAAYSIELEMEVPASTGYAVELRPESEASPSGYATVSRRMKHPVVLCGAISSGVYADSDAKSTLKRYPDAEAKQLRTCKIDVDASSVRVTFANEPAADAVGADLGSGDVLRLHIPASAQQPALIGNIKVAAAAGTAVTTTKKTIVITSAPRLIEFNTANGTRSTTPLLAQGGEPVADLVEQPGANGVDLHPGPLHYTDIVAKIPVTHLGELFSQWASGGLPPLDGRLVGGDFNYKAQYQRTFTQARLTELSFPALDGATKEPGYLQFRLAPASTRVEAAAGDMKGNLGKKQKQWLVSNFSVAIPGLATTRVSRIEPFALALKPGRNYLGGTRLTLTFASVDAATWTEWQEEFLLKGTGAPERTIEIRLLEPNLRDTLLTLQGSGVGLLSLSVVPQEINSEKISRQRAELYVERWTLVPSRNDE